MKENRNKIYIALGSNLRSFSFKNTKMLFNSIIFRLGLLGIKVKKKSGIWQSNPIPFSCGPTFFNSVIECSLIYNYELRPQELLKKISKLEQILGKKIKGKNKQRVIDIDLIDFHGNILANNLFLPHPRMHLRKFVLLPLYELDKQWCHPQIKKNCIFLISKIKGNQLVKKSKMFS